MTYNLPVKPTKLLRHFLGGHPELQHLSTQRGLAELVDRSESLLRAVEGDRVDMSTKFARAISDKTGVSKEWLLQESVAGTEVLAIDGTPLRYETVIALLTGRFDHGTQHAEPTLPEPIGIASEISAPGRTLPAPLDEHALITFAEAVLKSMAGSEPNSEFRRRCSELLEKSVLKRYSAMAPSNPGSDTGLDTAQGISQ